MSDEEKPVERCKVLYFKTVSTEGLVQEDDDFLRISTDNGNSWSRIRKDQVLLTIPIN